MTSYIKDYIALAREVDKETFVQRHPYPFLIHRTQEQSLAPRDEYSSTLRMRKDTETKQWRVEPIPPAPMDQVETLKKSQRNSVAEKILVGRTETNDLVVTHMTVSKHHAFFTTDAQGLTVITDTGSTNGTRLNGQELAAREARTLTDGDQLAFGDIAFLFYGPAAFHDLMRSISAMV